VNKSIRFFISFIVPVACVIAFDAAAFAATTTVVDQEFDAGTGFAYALLGTAQTFTVGKNGSLERVDLDMRAGYGTLYLQPVVNGILDADPSHALATRNVGYNGGDWLPVDLSNIHLQVSEGDMYGLLVIGSNQLYWGAALENEGNYTGGQSYSRVYDIFNPGTYQYKELSGMSDFNFRTYVAIDTPASSPTVTPEPSSLALFGLGSAALGFARRRRKKS
jgi:hypothetical protein